MAQPGQRPVILHPSPMSGLHGTHSAPWNACILQLSVIVMICLTLGALKSSSVILRLYCPEQTFACPWPVPPGGGG